VEEKLRTVIWDFAGEPVPAEYLASIQTLASPPSALAKELLRYLNAGELAALCLRAENLADSAVFLQLPSTRRAFPYPPL
jgi:hypothetical protein